MFEPSSSRQISPGNRVILGKRKLDPPSLVRIMAPDPVRENSFAFSWANLINQVVSGVVMLCIGGGVTLLFQIKSEIDSQHTDIKLQSQVMQMITQQLTELKGNQKDLSDRLRAVENKVN